MHVAASFDLHNENEQLMHGWMERFHSERNLYVMRALRRVGHLVHEVAEFLPQGEWVIITWNIDDISVAFTECVDRADAFRKYRELTHRSGGSARRVTLGASQDSPLKG